MKRSVPLGASFLFSLTLDMAQGWTSGIRLPLGFHFVPSIIPGPLVMKILPLWIVSMYLWGFKTSGTNLSFNQEISMAMAWHSSLTSVPLLLVLYSLTCMQLIVCASYILLEFSLFVPVAQARIWA